MKVKIILTALSKLTIQQILQQSVFLVKQSIKLAIKRIRDKHSSEQLDLNCLENLKISDGISFDQLPKFRMDTMVAEELLRMYLSHRFDLLGSGWIRCGFVDNAPGVEGYSYNPLLLSVAGNSTDWLREVVNELDFPKSEHIYKTFVAKDYSPIDWQKDFKTGYRWSAFDWYRPVTIAKEPGVDIKVPWELSRLQHLPQLAIFYRMFPDKQEQILREFINQCADFIAQNPVRKGVNWMCTMDIGIRTANMVMAFWLFDYLNAKIPNDFINLFSNSIYQHCIHIRNNLEWSATICTNHYFADICGLFFGAALLRENKVAQRWMKFARKEFSAELTKQFYEEGSNFEGSIGYHRLMGEMVAYTGILIQYLSEKGECAALSRYEKRLLANIRHFARDTMAPDGNFVQVGDNDSGRFFKLFVKGELMTAEEAKKRYASLEGYTPETEGEVYFDESVNSPQQMIALLEPFESYVTEKDYIRKFIKNRELQEGNRILPFKNTWEICPEQNGKSLQEGLEYIEYPQFGIYIFRSERIFLLLNGSDNGQKGNAGHGHNDKLSFELWIDQKPVYQDPGTYVYTAILEERDRYRSVDAHNGLLCGREQNTFCNTFSMKNETVCKKIMATRKSIMLEVCFGDVVQRREIEIAEQRIIIRDFSNYPFKTNRNFPNMTKGYGKKVCQGEC